MPHFKELRLTKPNSCSEYSFVEEAGKFEFYNMMDQILLYLMNLVYNKKKKFAGKIITNDSIVIHKYGEPRTIVYTIKNKPYLINTKYIMVMSDKNISSEMTDTYVKPLLKDIKNNDLDRVAMIVKKKVFDDFFITLKNLVPILNRHHFELLNSFELQNQYINEIRNEIRNEIINNIINEYKNLIIKLANDKQRDILNKIKLMSESQMYIKLTNEGYNYLNTSIQGIYTIYCLLMFGNIKELEITDKEAEHMLTTYKNI